MPVDFDNDLILVTAASGNQATGLLPFLVRKWKRLRLNVSSGASKEKLQKHYPDAEVVTSDLVDAHECKKLLDGVTACILITPSFHPKEAQCGINVIDAALENVRSGGRFKHFVHSSVIFPVIRKMINHDNKRYIEEHLVESGLPYTIIQPTHLMEIMSLANIIKQDQPTHPQFWDPSTPFSFVSCQDVGEAAANIFEQRQKHFYATYQLVGTREPLTYDDVAEIFEEEVGKPLKHDRKSIEEGVAMFCSMSTDSGIPQDTDFTTKQGVVRMFSYYNDKGIVGNSNVLEMLLGRKPLGYRDWVRSVVREVQEQ